ncbi:hypothetical protein HMPREF1169_03599 [Aeromonas veronii AER397]|nr:hypothetical protein HMPREF1169_03599 [Aeromonas veronii AER397]
MMVSGINLQVALIVTSITMVNGITTEVVQIVIWIMMVNGISIPCRLPVGSNSEAYSDDRVINMSR